MTARPLTFDFAIASPLAVRAPAAVPSDEILLELRLELDRRRKAYPRIVGKGEMTTDEAARHIAILAQIVDENSRAPDDLPFAAWRRQTDERIDRWRASPFRWEDKVRELRREIQLRRNIWPRWVETHKLDAEEARTRTERLDTAHFLYWIKLEHWDCEGEADLSPEGRAATRAKIRARSAEVDAWLETQQQGRAA